MKATDLIKMIEAVDAERLKSACIELVHGGYVCVAVAASAAENTHTPHALLHSALIVEAQNTLARTLLFIVASAELGLDKKLHEAVEAANAAMEEAAAKTSRSGAN